MIGSFAHIIDKDQSNIGTRLVGITLIIPEIQVAAKALVLRSAEPSNDKIRRAKSIVRCGMSVDRDLECWERFTPQSFSYSSLPAADWVEFGAWSDEMHMYQDLGSANLWNCYRTARIHLNKALLDVLIFLEMWGISTFPGYLSKCCTSLQGAIDDICSSIPFFLGNREAGVDLDAVKYPIDRQAFQADKLSVELYFKGTESAMAPLATCLASERLCTAQKNWIEGQIYRICRISHGEADWASRHRVTQIEDLSCIFFSAAVNIKYEGVSRERTS